MKSGVGWKLALSIQGNVHALGDEIGMLYISKTSSVTACSRISQEVVCVFVCVCVHACVRAYTCARMCFIIIGTFYYSEGWMGLGA